LAVKEGGNLVAEVGDAADGGSVDFVGDVAADAVGVAGAFEGDGLAGLSVHVDPDLAGVFDGFTVEREDDVFGFEASGGGGTFGADVGDDGSPIAGALEGFGQGSVMVWATTLIWPRRTRPNSRICS